GGLFVQQEDSFKRPAGLDSGLHALAVMHEAGGDTWVGTSTGLIHYRGCRTEWVARSAQLTSPDVRCISRDKTGALWFGMFGGGLGCLKDCQLQQYRRTDGLPSDYVQCLRPDADGSLWIGTFGGGLVRRKDGRFAVINRDQGLPSNDIGDIEEDGR